MNIDHSIYELYLKHPTKLASMRSIALSLGKSYPIIHQHLTNLIEKGFLKKIIVGKSNLCTLNYSNPSLLSSLSSIESVLVDKAISSDSSVGMLYSFLNQTFIPELVSCILVDNQLVFIVSSNQAEKKITDLLKQTTISKKITFLQADEFSSFLQSSHTIISGNRLVLVGKESYHSLIRDNYQIIQQIMGSFENE